MHIAIAFYNLSETLHAACLMWHVAELWLHDFIVRLSVWVPLCCHLKQTFPDRVHCLYHGPFNGTHFTIMSRSLPLWTTHTHTHRHRERETADWLYLCRVWVFNTYSKTQRLVFIYARSLKTLNTLWRSKYKDTVLHVNSVNDSVLCVFICCRTVISYIVLYVFEELSDFSLKTLLAVKGFLLARLLCGSHLSGPLPPEMWSVLMFIKWKILYEICARIWTSLMATF